MEIRIGYKDIRKVGLANFEKEPSAVFYIQTAQETVKLTLTLPLIPPECVCEDGENGWLSDCSLETLETMWDDRAIGIHWGAIEELDLDYKKEGLVLLNDLRSFKALLEERMYDEIKTRSFKTHVRNTSWCFSETL